MRTEKLKLVYIKIRHLCCFLSEFSENYLLHILQNVLINAVGDSSSRVVIVVVSPAKCHINLETLKTQKKEKTNDIHL